MENIMKYLIKSRSGGPQFVAHIEGNDDASDARKRGLAAQWGSENDEDLHDCDLQDAIFTDCQMVYADFRDCILANAVFSDANIKYATFTNCNLQSADFTKANASATTLTNCDLLGARFDGFFIL